MRDIKRERESRSVVRAVVIFRMCAVCEARRRGGEVKKERLFLEWLFGWILFIFGRARWGLYFRVGFTGVFSA